MSPPSHLSSSSEEPILVSGFGFCQERQEILRLRRPPSTHLHSQHDKSRSSTPSNQFGMSSFLSSSGRNQRHTIPPVSPCSRRPISPQGTHQCGVHCKLGTSMQWQTIHHLQSSGVSRIFQSKIEIAHQNVGGNSSTCLTTDPRRNTLNRKSPSNQNPSSSARCAVMAMSIEEVATPAGTHGKRKRQLETTEQEHSEQVRIQIGDAARWARSQSQTGRSSTSSSTTFIKKKFSSKSTFIKNHFHQKPLSSKTNFIKKPLIKMPLSSKTTFIKNHFHQKPFSSKTNFIKNQFHQKPISSEHFLSEGPTTATPSHKHGLCPPLGSQLAFLLNIAGRRPAMFSRKAR